MAGVVLLPWYATGFRGDDLATALERVSKISLRYGANSHVVYRSRDDRYQFLQVIDFDDKIDWERYWLGPEMIDFRTSCQGWYQVPITYVWQDIVVAGAGPGRGPGSSAESGADAAARALGKTA